MKVVVVIPAYQPDEELIRLLEELHAASLSALIVDDGSAISCKPIFDAAEQYGKVIHAPKNEGKGAALKRGFAAIAELYPDCSHIITADADGQHRPADILRVRDALEAGAEFVLTVRRLQGDIPARSRFGNGLSRVVYTAMIGHYFDDNQSGLRGFEVKHIEWLLKVGGNKYDYEMNMLCFADKQRITITPLPIEAIYIDGNRSSHFDPVADTLRIYKRLFGSTWPSLVAVGYWAIFSLVCSILLGYRELHQWVPTAVMSAAFLSILFNRLFVFRGIPYRDGLRTVFFALIRAAAYTSITRIFAVFLPMVPIWLVLGVVAFVMVFVEFFIHKGKHKIFNKKR